MLWFALHCCCAWLLHPTDSVRPCDCAPGHFGTALVLAASQLVVQNKEVSGLAGCILEQWLRTLAAHTAVLADHKYVEDPRKALASRCGIVPR